MDPGAKVWRWLGEGMGGGAAPLVVVEEKEELLKE
jgi:hypothetical protein